MPDQRASIPSHVDPRLVVDFDYLNPPGLAEHGDIYRAWRTLQTGPDIVWTPHHGGHWILTRGDDIKWAQETYEVLSHKEIAVPRGTSPDLPPITLDPPESMPYRAALNPMFTKRRVEETYAPRIRALTVELIEQIKPRGRCEFVSEFAKVMPVTIFLGIVGLDTARRQEFLEWGRGFSQVETRPIFAKKIAAALSEGIQERIAAPRDDLLTHFANWRHSPHFKGDEEMLHMAMLIFQGGLDTVAYQLAFAMRHLAQNPRDQQRLRDEPAIIPAAIEEFLRRHGLSSTSRLVTQDCDRKGARFRVGDMVMVPIGLSGMDDRLYERPLEIDFDRPETPHNTFGNGAHKCVGANLARMEFAIFLEEWFARMPDVRLDPERPPQTFASFVVGVKSLDLLWDA